MEYPRLLVLSNNSFSKSNSNGRTLGSLLYGWPKERIAQFCISTDGPDFDICGNYYCVTDGDVLKSILKFSPAHRRKLNGTQHINSNYVGGKKRFKKTALNMLCRNFAWELGLWKGKEFKEWILNFKPEIVLLQSGDSFFMHDLARIISMQTGANLAVFNTEAAYLFKRDYFLPDASIIEKILFPLYRKIYNRSFLKFMSKCEKAIYGNLLLQRDYKKAIPKHCDSIVIYTASDIKFSKKSFDKDTLYFSYLGNMGFYRPKALAIVGKVLQSISPDYYLDVYGSPQNEENERLLVSSPGIRFHGQIEYEEVKKVMQESDILFHVEFESQEYSESLKYGFSTKIADSITSKRIFVLYAPINIAGSQYIKESGAGVFCENEIQLRKALCKIIEDSNYRENILKKAEYISSVNHSQEVNREKMREALL